MIENFLKAKYEERKARNKKYSIRSFAKSLGVSPSLISQVFNDKKKISLGTYNRIKTHLNLNHIESENFNELFATRQKEDDLEYQKLQREKLTLDQFTKISNWQSFAILSLAKMDNNKKGHYWIAKQLAIKKEDALNYYQNLLSSGMIKEEAEHFYRTTKSFEIDQKVPSSIISNFHKENLKKVINSIEQYSINERVLNSITISTSTELIPKIEKEMKVFCNRVDRLCEKESKQNQVYNLSIQFSPLSGVTRDH